MAATCATASPTAARSPSSSAASASASASSSAPAAPRSALPAGPAAPPGLHPAQDRALVNTGAINALAALPAARSPALRSPRSLNMDRSSNREALLAQCRGVVAAAPCAHCAKGSGPWTDCVVVAGLLGGSCANCHFGGSGARCSLRASAPAPPARRPGRPSNRARTAAVLTPRAGAVRRPRSPGAQLNDHVARFRLMADPALAARRSELSIETAALDVVAAERRQKRVGVEAEGDRDEVKADAFE